jgi:biopolymer transport protein TolR
MNRRPRYSKRNRRAPMSEINIVPYIDVMLVLLMVFMLTTPLLNQSVPVQLPKETSQALQANQKNPIMVTVNQSGDFYLNIASHPEKAIDQTQMNTLVSAAIAKAKDNHESLPVFVRGDSQASYGQIVKAMVILQNAGADHVGLVTQPFD